MSALYKSEAGAHELRRRYQEQLRDWPVPAERLRVPTREGETFVVAPAPRTPRPSCCCTAPERTRRTGGTTSPPGRGTSVPTPSTSSASRA
ncbi:hypothetical protein [Streptomyces angustmyceticus]|uniref:hypothetical protein n=1 Tax=Streptomyces angustmyceticus TaxID=285578 RepID=UPI0021AEE0C2|nr:hypothetical protein [Streptomyces angustmyceticus]